MRQGLDSCRIARLDKRKCRFALDALTRGSELQSLCRAVLGFRGIAVSRLLQRSISQIDRPTFFVVRSHGGVHSSLGQFPGFAKMTDIRLGVGCKRKADVLVFGLARIPLLLLRHRRRVRPEKGKSIESTVQYEIIYFSRLRLMDDLPRLVEALQGNGIVGEIVVQIHSVRCKAHGLPRDLRGLLILPLFRVHIAQTVVGVGFPRVALNPLLIYLDRFIQFPGYIRIVVGGDTELFPLTGMFPQLKCLAEVLAGPP